MTATDNGGKTLVSFQTHTFGYQVRRAFLQMARTLPPNYEAVALVHLAPGQPVPRLMTTVPHVIVRTPEIRIPEYGAKSGLDDPRWTIWAGGHTDLSLLCLVRGKPGYAYYWSVEYDVRYTGPWRDLFSRYRDTDADFIATSICDPSTTPAWAWWDALTSPAGIRPPAHAEMLGSLMSIFRASSRMVSAMDHGYRNGWSGHCEVAWPTLARHFKMSVLDLGGEGPYVRPQDRGQVYSSRVATWSLSPGTFVFRPLRAHTSHVALRHFSLQRGRLWHPVKPIGSTIREDWIRVCGKVKTLAASILRALQRHPAPCGQATLSTLPSFNGS